MQESSNPKLKTFFLAVGMVLLLCIAASALWLDVENDRYQGRAMHRQWEYSVEPATIGDWMTFDYLNAVFKLPPEYLQTALGIQDSRYPNISLRQYAQNHAIDEDIFLGQVQKALAARTASTTPVSP